MSLLEVYANFTHHKLDLVCAQIKYLMVKKDDEIIKESYDKYMYQSESG